MLSGKTSTGFEYSVSDEALDDWEFFEILDELDEKPQLAIRLLKIMLGSEGYNSLKNHVKKINGKVTVTAMSKEIEDIMNSNQETKNL